VRLAGLILSLFRTEEGLQVPSSRQRIGASARDSFLYTRIESALAPQLSTASATAAASRAA
jgi:hypothetical protein